MKVGKVIGTVVSTVKHSSLSGQKLLIVLPLHPDGKSAGNSVLAIDTVQAGMGDTVLLMEEGNSARMILGQSMGPVRSVIAGIVDSVEIHTHREER
jgi:ethanolamine utilization protein EutN